MFKRPTVLIRIGFIVLLGATGLGLIAGCQSKLIYFPRPYASGTAERWQRECPGKTIDYTSSQGRQRAFLQGRLESPRNLWVVCGGNGTVALDWSDWLKSNGPDQDAWLLVDFPGYGDSEGSPSPGRIRENLATAVPLAWKELGFSGNPDPQRLRYFGHSLGSAATLIAASDFQIRRGLLISPFTSTMDMCREVTGLPLGFLVWHRFDNSARLAELAKLGEGKVTILHGSDDEVIPIEMGRKLASQHSSIVRLIEIPGGRHNTIQEQHADIVSRALIATGND